MLFEIVDASGVVHSNCVGCAVGADLVRYGGTVFGNDQRDSGIVAVDVDQQIRKGLRVDDPSHVCLGALHVFENDIVAGGEALTVHQVKRNFVLLHGNGVAGIPVDS